MSPTEAFLLLEELGAPLHLRRHATLVHEAAVELLKALHRELPGSLRDLEEDLVCAGAILHDVGKILHPEELHQPGHAHEEAGLLMLQTRGVAPALARICVSHAQWAAVPCSREELLVALSDKLWKGKRVEALEEIVSRTLALASGKDFWEVHPSLLDVCDQIAAEGDARLTRSV